MFVPININFESLVELSVRLNETHDEEFILKSALYTLMGKLRITKACIFAPDAQKENYIPIVWRGKVATKSVPHFNITDIINDKAEIEMKFGTENSFRLLVPLIYKDIVYSVFCLGENISQDDLTEVEIQYAKIVAAITANALQDARNHQILLNSKTKIERRNQLLSTLFEMSREFNTLLSKNDILKMLSYRLMGQLMVSRFAIVLKEKNDSFDAIVNRFEKQFDEKTLTELFTLTETCSPACKSISAENIESLEKMGARIISPMFVQGNIKGLLIVGKKMNNVGFTEENINFIEALGNLASSALENERLFQEELDKKKLESEMELALEIQENLLPKVLPENERYEFAGKSSPSLLVGGDYFDFIELSGNRILCAIADVSGKGMPAALLMANVQAALRALAPLELPLDELIRRINRVVYHNTTADKFVTFFCGVLDTVSNKFQFINAGHNPPFIFRHDGSIVPLTEGGIILGITDAGMQYFDNTVDIEPGDMLLLYTDGATEAMNRDDEEFSEDNLLLTVRNNLKEPLNEIISVLLKSISEHSKGIHQSDDITFACFRRHR